MAEREGIMAGVAEVEIAGIPVGQAVAGGLVAGIFDGLVSLIPQFKVGGAVPQLIVRSLAAWTAIKWGPRVFGTKAAQTAGLFLAYDAMQQLFDFRGMFSRLISGVKLGGIEQEEIELPPELLSAGVSTGVGQELPKEGAKRGLY
jgi:hypothetical protein